MKHCSSTSKPCAVRLWGGGVLFAAAILLSATATAATATISGAPDAYLDYVEATGTQYINTGVNAETGLKARIDMEWGAEVTALNKGGDDWSMLDARKTGDTRFYMCHIAKNTAGNDIVFGYGYNTWHRTATSAVRKTRFEVLTDFSDQATLHYYKNGAEMLDNGQKTGHADETIDLGINLYLFACNYDGKASYGAHAKLYECKIFKKKSATGDMELLRHFLPARKDGHTGLYDKVNNMFYYDAANKLVAGAVLDRPLALVESLTSDGADDTYQCFNTWVWGKSGLKSEVEVSLFAPGSDRGILACRETKGDTRLFMAYTYESAFRFATGELKGKADLNVVATATGKRYVIKTDTTPGAQSMTVSTDGGEAVEVLKNGVDYGSAYMATTNTLTLLATHRAYDNNFATPVEATLYATKIWDGDELLRDFVPAIATNSEGVVYAGLYDKVSERVYKPLKGKISTERACPFDLESEVGVVTNVLAEAAAPAKRIDYVESDGAADYIDLGVPANDGIEMETVMEWRTAPDDDVFVGARLATSGDNANTRFFLYNAWPAHSIGYAKDLPRLGNDNDGYLTPNAGVRYRISSRLDNGEQSFVLEEYSNDTWTRLGETQRSYSGPMNLGIPLYLFARNLNGKADSFSCARVYSLKLWTKTNGKYELVRDLTPVNDPLTGGKALWDKVEGKYYRSSGKFRLAGGGDERPLTPGMMIILK